MLGAGHGFIRDDYEWIVDSAVTSWGALLHLFHTDNGFYRPLVSLTFALNRWMFGAGARGYGLTNVALALLCAASIGLLMRSLRFPRGAAIVAAALWLSNVHGIGMAVLWVSGRTSLLVTLASVLAAVAWLRGRPILAGALVLAALLSKEEAALLPIVLLLWSFTLRKSGAPAGVRPATWIAAAAIAEGVYFALRGSTGAMTPWSAPSFYRFTFSAPAVARNLFEYADRTATLDVLVVALAWFVLRPRSTSPADPSTRRVLWSSAIWLAGALAPTFLLPVRSDLHVCLPSVGAAIAAAAACTRLWNASTVARQRHALAVAIALPIALSPVYYLRTNRWVSLANLAATSLTDLSRLTRSLPDEAVVVLHDDRSGRTNLASAFGTLLDDAGLVATGRRLDLRLDPPADEGSAAAQVTPCAGCLELYLDAASGHLRPR